MTCTEQLDLHFAEFAVFTTVEEAGFMLDELSKQQVYERLESGHLLGVDIKRPAAQKRSLRIAKYSVIHHLAKPDTLPAQLRLDSFLWRGRKRVSYAEVAAQLACSVDHIANLGFRCPSNGRRSKYCYPEVVIRWLEERWVA